jgi:hypothetical protein
MRRSTAIKMVLVAAGSNLPRASTPHAFLPHHTALCPLTGGEVMYLPGAFTRSGLAEIRARIAPKDRIVAHGDDALYKRHNDMQTARCQDINSDSPLERRLFLQRRG